MDASTTESICTDQAIVEANIRSVKISSPDVSWLLTRSNFHTKLIAFSSTDHGIQKTLSKTSRTVLKDTKVNQRPD